ncbi:hypothetical protein Nmel_016777, partial [Mimus melanotis]
WLWVQAELWILAGLPVGQQQGPGGVAGEAADGGGGRALRGGGEHQIHLQGLRAQTDPGPGPGQSRGCHGFHRAHDPAHLPHAASRGRADPLHNGLAFFHVRASIPPRPCPA